MFSSAEGYKKVEIRDELRWEADKGRQSLLGRYTTKWEQIKDLWISSLILKISFIDQEKAIN